MGSMTDERRKEMEEEMMRFELEIAGPEEDGVPSKRLKAAKSHEKADGSNVSKSAAQNKVLKPQPPASTDKTIHHEPLQPPPMPRMQPPPRMQFVPHQLRQPPRPPRPPMGPMPGPPGFQRTGQMPFPQQFPMQMPPMGMHMPHGFRPPPPGMNMGPMPPQPFAPPMSMPFPESGPQKPEHPSSKTTRSDAVVSSGPAIYAAPPKSFVAKPVLNTSASNGPSVAVVTVKAPTVSQPEEPKVIKAIEEPIMMVPPMLMADAPLTKKEKRKKKIVRMAGGQAWEDNSLLDWETDDFRIFCGDLGNDVTDEVLIRAFSKYPSFGKAKVIRDKRTNKTKGYGFVSFKDPQDFIKAMREMNGRYVGSRPIKLRKSTWRDRNIEIVRKKQKEKEKLGLL